MGAEPENDVMKQMRLRRGMRVQEAQEFLQRNQLVVLAADEAQRRVREADLPFREVDVAEPIFSAGLQPGRITVMVKEVVVVTADVGN